MLYKSDLAFIADYFRYESKTKRIIAIVSAASLSAAVIAIVKIPTLFIPGWFLALLYLPILIGASFILGKALHALLPFRIDFFTYTLVVIATLSLWFCYIQYNPTSEITIPAQFNGPIRLFLSNESVDDFKLNKHGVGYISKETYKQGFKPKITQEGVDISDRIPYGSHVTSSYQSTTKHTVSYTFIQLSATSEATSVTNSIEELIRVGALDTIRAKQQIISSP